MFPGGQQGPQLPATSHPPPLSAHRDPAPVNKEQHQNCINLRGGDLTLHAAQAVDRGDTSWESSSPWPSARPSGPGQNSSPCGSCRIPRGPGGSLTPGFRKPAFGQCSIRSRDGSPALPGSPSCQPLSSCGTFSLLVSSCPPRGSERPWAWGTRGGHSSAGIPTRPWPGCHEAEHLRDK